MNTVRQQSTKGFTVVELVVVIVVIGVLAMIVVVVHRGSRQQTAETVLQSDLMNASAQLAVDNNFNNTYPSTMAAADGGKGLPKSDGTTYSYDYTAATNSYCLTATNTAEKARPFYITNTDTAAKQGECP